jgi:hypothetical protein
MQTPQLDTTAPEQAAQPQDDGRPVLLTPEQLAQISGGGPNGTWASAESLVADSLSGPNGTW